MRARQRGRRQQDRSEEEERERIFEPAGEKHQDRKLQDVEGEQPGGAVRFEPPRLPEQDAERDIEPGRQRDDGETAIDRQVEFEAEIDDQNGRGLGDDRQPAQPHQRVEPHVAARHRKPVEADRWHGVGHGVGACCVMSYLAHLSAAPASQTAPLRTAALCRSGLEPALSGTLALPAAERQREPR